MSDFLDRMAFRAQGAAPVLQPRPLSLYEGGPDLFEEVHEEREAAPATPSAPARAARRRAEPGPDGRPAETGPDRIPEPWAEEAPARAQRSSVPGHPRPVPDEAIQDPLPAAPGEAAAPAAGVASPAAAPMPAAIVRRQAGKAEAGPADRGGSAPFADSSEAPGIDPDPEPPESAAIRAAAPVRSEIVTRRSDASVGGVPLASLPVAGEPAPADGAAAAEFAPASPRAGTREAALRAVPARAVPAAESMAPSAVSTHSGVHPFAPHAESAQAPASVEIRIGRIDIHAAPPAAPAAPVAAPGPSLDAFLARPRR